jgi:hypothetical protein
MGAIQIVALIVRLWYFPIIFSHKGHKVFTQETLCLLCASCDKPLCSLWFKNFGTKTTI